MNNSRKHLLHAARLALRGHGRAEPNPLVGCVIVSPEDRVVGWGYHAGCGSPHAEIHALRRAGEKARGATAYVTLSPCNHVGRTGPCSRAIIDAGVARVVVARDDPNPVSQGGVEAMRAAGIEVIQTDVCPEAADVSDPFVHRIRTGLPWVIVKWAQTLDGRIATRTGESQWISSTASRRLVHRERGRVDAILTGVGTILRDDPMLTARGVRIRRVARRIVIDPALQTPLASRVVQTAKEYPTTITCDAGALESAADRTAALRAKGVELLGVASIQCGLPLDTVMRELTSRYLLSNVLVEAGPGLCNRLFRESMVNELWAFIAGLVLGDDDAMAPVRGFTKDNLSDAAKLRLVGNRTRCGDVVLRYRLA